MGITTELKEISKELKKVQEHRNQEFRRTSGHKINFYDVDDLISNNGVELVPDYPGEMVTTVHISPPTADQIECGLDGKTEFLEDKEK